MYTRDLRSGVVRDDTRVGIERRRRWAPPALRKRVAKKKCTRWTRRVPSAHQRARPGTYLGSREHGAAIRAEIGGTPLARDDASHLVGACAAPRVVELTALTSVCDTGAKNFLSSRSVGANSAATRAHPQRLTHPRVSLTPVGAAP
jgi:hypothetical protein